MHGASLPLPVSKRAPNLCEPNSASSTSRHIETRDVTCDPALMHDVIQQVAMAYTALASPGAALSLKQVDAEVCCDPYSTPDRSTTLAALMPTEAQGNLCLAGTIRVVFGDSFGDADHPAIESMRFMVPLEEWPHRQIGLNDSSIAEFGRFVIADRFRTTEMNSAGVTSAISRSLCESALELVRSRGKRALYAIMPAHMAGMGIRGGCPVMEIPSRLRLECPYASGVIRRFETYWLHQSPRLYQATGIN